MARKRTKATGPQASIRRTFAVPSKLSRRLGAYARHHGKRESDLVARALTELLKGFYVVDGAEPPAEAEESGRGAAA